MLVTLKHLMVTSFIFVFPTLVGAEGNQNPLSVCLSEQSSSQRLACYKGVLASSPNFGSACANFDGDLDRLDCLDQSAKASSVEIASELRNCNKIKSQKYLIMCYKKRASKQEMEACWDAGNENKSLKCFEYIAFPSGEFTSSDKEELVGLLTYFHSPTKIQYSIAVNGCRIKLTWRRQAYLPKEVIFEINLSYIDMEKSGPYKDRENGQNYGFVALRSRDLQVYVEEKGEPDKSYTRRDIYTRVTESNYDVQDADVLLKKLMASCQN